jgi:shikimate kinase
LLRTDNPRKTLEDLCRQRNPVYALADLVVDADAAYSIEEMASKVARTLAKRPDILELSK